jgi:EpsI family protein
MKSYIFAIILIAFGGLIGNALRFVETEPDGVADFSHIPIAIDDYFGEEYILDDASAEALSPKHCLPGGGWRIESLEPFELRFENMPPKIINHSTISSRNNRVAMFYWFETRSGSTRNEYNLKLDLIKNALSFNATDAAIIRLTVDAPESPDRVNDLGIRFMNRFYPHIKKALPF